MHDQAAIDLIVGMDVGKRTHYVVGCRRDGTEVLAASVANEEAAIQAILTAAQTHGVVLVVVDQPASIGALPVAVAHARGVRVAYLPGFALRQIADSFPGETKTDARDARIIVEAARTMPRVLRALPTSAPTVATLRLLCGRDDDLAQEWTATSNRLRDLLTQLHPPLERVLGPVLAHQGVLALLQRWPLPAQLGALSEARLTTFLRRQGARQPAALARAIRTALAQQMVVVPGTAAAALIVPQLAAHLALVRDQRAALMVELEARVVTHPFFPVLTSLPGFGVRTAAKTVVELAGREFATAGQLAAYAGVAPVTRQSGTSLRHERAARRGNKTLKNVFCQAAFASLRHPPSRRYYDRKRAEGKRHTQALLCLARRRVDVIFAMLRDGTPYHAPPLTTT